MTLYTDVIRTAVNVINAPKLVDCRDPEYETCYRKAKQLAYDLAPLTLEMCEQFRRLRLTAPVDDDFPEIMGQADLALMNVINVLEKEFKT